MTGQYESVVQGEILKAYQNHPNIKLWRQNVGAARMSGGAFVRFGLPGQADISGIIAPSGRALFIEVKSATGRQSPKQVVFQRFVERYGAVYVLARGLSDVQKVLSDANIRP